MEEKTELRPDANHDIKKQRYSASPCFPYHITNTSINHASVISFLRFHTEETLYVKTQPKIAAKPNIE